MGEGIPIPDSLGEEATFINICIGNGSLKCHRVLISTTPSFGDKVICWYTVFTLKTFIMELFIMIVYTQQICTYQHIIFLFVKLL